jgi:hypothetical protein
VALDVEIDTYIEELGVAELRRTRQMRLLPAHQLGQGMEDEL